MSAERWKPGDVAWMVAANGVEGIVLRFDAGHECRWADKNGPLSSDGDWIETVRPLVVIDPEGRDVNRLIVRLGTRVRASCAEMRQVLRDLHTDPKPDEPTGLGAVVEDASGWQWIRIYAPVGYQWQYLNQRAPYSDINAVRVLSEGVDA